MANSSSRRKFIRQLSSTAALFTGSTMGAMAMDEDKIHYLQPEKRHLANDKIRVAGIGMGIMGFGDMRAALKVPGVEIAGVCDLYQGHLDHAKELYGNDLYTTRDYRELLLRKDIDAVIIATPDHWHDHISIAAMKAGKHVYCEKPMVQHLDEGHAVIKTQQETGKVLIVGSQGVSSITLAEAKKRINYGTGVAGDLFIHLISAVHHATDSNGPTRIFSSGQLSYWKDGRDVPDVLTSIMDYPTTENHAAFQMQWRVNFADGSGGSNRTRIVGSEGVLEWGDNKFTLKRKKLPKAEPLGSYDSFINFSDQQRIEYVKWYNEKYSAEDQKTFKPEEIKYAAPEGYDARVDHFANFFQAIRSNGTVVEDPTFGLRAAGPALASNLSYEKGKVIKWDPINMKVVK